MTINPKDLAAAEAAIQRSKTTHELGNLSRLFWTLWQRGPELDRLGERLRQRYAELEGMVVWHYTSVDAAKSIIESNEIYASHLGFLNDRMEGLQFGEVLVAWLRNMQIQRDDPIWKEWMERLIDGFNPKLPDAYVASFMLARDRLDSWRVYAAEGRGIALGFNREILQRPVKEATANYYLRKCDYVDPADLTGLSDGLRLQIYRNVNEDFPRPPDLGTEATRLQQLQMQLQGLHSVVRGFGPTVKHFAFEEEREYRMILHQEQLKRSDVEYTERRNSLVPFVRIKYSPDALTTVLLGPGLSDRPEHEEAMRGYLQSIERGNVGVQRSGVPIRAT